jgi:undecaprenyl-phosphate 4-deoxy-4-formamido-L-arabinose transferase
LQSLSADLDLVYGTPNQQSHAPWRYISSVLARAALATIVGIQISGKISAFRALRGQLRSSFSDYRSPFVSIDVLLSWSTTRIGSVAVRHDPRRFGRSQYTPLRLLRHLINMVTGFSVWPLRVASIIGFIFFCFGLSVLAYVLIRYFFSGSSVPGFPFLASIIALFSGAQMFALGIVGEYLARLYLRLLDRPPYVIETTINLKAE